MKLSILIPTHNRSGVLLRTLDRLAAVRLPEGAEAEAVVVANACKDETFAAVTARAVGFPFNLRCVEEPQPGVAHARNRALREASGELYFFLDDDIGVEPDWIEQHLAVYRETNASMAGGRIGLWFGERQPPEWLLPALESVLSWKDLGPERREVLNPGDCISGNMSMRREVPESIGGFHTGLGRRAGSMLGGEEIDFVERALHAGFKVYYTPKASGQHWIPAAFFEDAYLRRLATDMGRSRVLMKKRLSAGAVFRRLLVNPVRIAAHLAGGAVALLAGNRRRWMEHRIKRWKQQGGFWATLQRITGQAAAETRAQPATR